MMVLILISLFLCVFLRFVFILQSESTDNWGHLSMVRSRKSLQSPFNYQAVNSVVKGKMAYPQFFHYLVNLLFYNNIILGGQLLNIFFDCIIVLISIFLTYYFTNRFFDILLIYEFALKMQNDKQKSFFWINKN